MNETEAFERVFAALNAAGVNYNRHAQTGRVQRLMELPEVSSVYVVRGGYRPTKRTERVVLGYCNSRRHGKRVYTVVAELRTKCQSPAL